MMNGLPVHPAIVHIPLVIALLVPFALAWLAWRAWRGNGKVTARQWMVALALQLVIVGAGLVALRSGQAEEERVEATVAERAVEAHEKRATTFLWGAAALLVLVGAGAALPRASRALAPASLAVSLVVAGLGVAAGHAGGSIVHGTTAANVAGEPARGAGVDDD